MEQALRQRLTGAVALVVLAVVFVPLILDGPPPQRRDLIERMAEQDRKAAAEARQQAARETGGFEVLPLQPPEQVAKVVVDERGQARMTPVSPPVVAPVNGSLAAASPQQSDASLNAAPRLQEKPKSDPGASAKATSPASSTPKPAREQKRAEATMTKPAQASTRRTPRSAVTGSDHWLIQTDTFSSQANARKRSKQLLELGYTSEIEPGNGKFRVVIGPIAGRDMAEKVSKKVNAALRVKSILRRTEPKS